MTEWSEIFLTAGGPRDGRAMAVASVEAGSKPRERRRFFKRLRENLGKTRTALVGELRSSLGDRLDDHTWEQLEEALIFGDVGVPTTAEIVATLERLTESGAISTGEDLVAALRSEIADLLSPAESPASESRIDVSHHPTVILTVGVNGTGKTTTIGKLAWHVRKELGLSVLLAAADTFRAAAVDQLAIWAERSGSEIVRSAPGADPGAVAFDAIEAAKARGIDVVIVDTAGRLHTQTNLMEELAKIRRVIESRIPEAPHETLLTIDATTGQNGLRQGKLFSEAVGVSGVCLTKLDGTAKGGVALPIVRDLGVPIKLIGIGESLEDLRPFDAGEFAEAMVG